MQAHNELLWHSYHDRSRASRAGLPLWTRTCPPAIQRMATPTPGTRDSMLIFGALTLALLFIVNQRLHASYLHPACLFSGMWFALLTGLILAGDAFNPISGVTVLIYLSGALSFTLGGRLVTRSAVRRPRLPQPAFEVKRIGRMIDAGICILLALIPFYWSRLSMIAEISAHHVFLTCVRAAMVENQKDSFGVFTYVLSAGMLLSLIAAAIDDGSWWARIRTVAIIAITLGYYAVTGSRLGSEVTLIGVAAVGCLRSNRLYVGRLLLAGSLLLVIFTVPAIILRCGEAAAGLITAPSGASEPYSTAIPACGWSGSDRVRMTSASQISASSRYSTRGAPVTVSALGSSRSRTSRSTACRPPARKKSSMRKRPAGCRSTSNGTCAPVRSKSSWRRSMPSRP